MTTAQVFSPARIVSVIGGRRLIFLLLALAVGGVMILPLGIPPMVAGDPSRDLFQAFEKLEAGDPILISLDFDPASKAELDPAARAVLRHAFRKRLRVIAMGLWQTGIGLANEIVETEADTARRRDPGSPPEAAYPVYGKDYVFLGWQPGMFAVIVRLTEGIQGTYPQDIRGNRTEDLQIWSGGGRRIRTLGDLKLLVTISAGNPGIDEWIQYGRGKEKVPIAAAVTGVSTPGRMPFYNSGQIIGLLGGMRGAAEYELLINGSEQQHEQVGSIDTALNGMTALSASHFLVIGLVVVSNVLYLFARERGSR